MKRVRRKRRIASKDWRASDTFGDYWNLLLWMIGWNFRLLRGLARYALLSVLFIFVVSYLFWSTERDKRYRYLPEYNPICVEQRNGKDEDGVEHAAILARHNRLHNDEFAAIKLSKNPERDKRALSCMLQKHVIPGDEETGRRRIEYYVSFLEFRENGQPAHDDDGEIDHADYRHDPTGCYDVPGRIIDQHKRKKDAEERARGEIPVSSRPVAKAGHITPERDWFPTQNEALVNHLKCRHYQKHFVLAFVHGWRHNAMIGNEDVQRGRVFAAYTKSFLEQRCDAAKHNGDARGELEFCDVTVTLVYVGWRGNRIDEDYLYRTFGGHPHASSTAVLQAIDGLFSLPALLTLFDRKPVSERIAASVNNALYQIDQNLFFRGEEGQNRRRLNRMVTFGHSLGGNILAYGMKDELIARIRNHDPKSQLTLPFGDMAVLINPASEAGNWTALQRAMRERIAFHHTQRDFAPTGPIEDELKKLSDDKIDAGFEFFNRRQKPIVVSLTAANTWPVGNTRISDCRRVFDAAQDEVRYAINARKKLDPATALMRSLAEEATNPRYDRDTHDFFPFFRGDFRPLAETFELTGKSTSLRAICSREAGAREPWPWWLDWMRIPEYKLIRWAAYSINQSTSQTFEALAAMLRNFPFMTTDLESTRTIGHLNPLRGYIPTDRPGRPAAHFGTTHELLIEAISQKNPAMRYPDFMKTHYYNAADFKLAYCGTAHGMLESAKQVMAKDDLGRNWISTNLISDRAGVALDEKDDKGNKIIDPALIEAYLKHGYLISPIYPVTRPNDPFWNIRVRDTGMQGHGGYDSYPLICFIQQLVMDDVTRGSPEPRKDRN